jgi:hypothetical protein
MTTHAESGSNKSAPPRLQIYRDSASRYSAYAAISASAENGRTDTAYSFALALVMFSSVHGRLKRTRCIHRTHEATAGFSTGKLPDQAF